MVFAIHAFYQKFFDELDENNLQFIFVYWIEHIIITSIWEEYFIIRELQKVINIGIMNP